MTEDPGFTVSDAEDGDDAAPSKKKGKRRSGRDVVALITSDLMLCRTPDDRALVGVPHEAGHCEWYICPSGGLRGAIQNRYFNHTRASQSFTVQAEQLSLFAARCRAEGETRRAFHRVAVDRGDLVIDLGGSNPKGERRAVRVTPNGWKIVAATDVEVAFLRAAGQLPLPEPEPDGASWKDLKALVNVTTDDEVALILAWLVCGFRAFLERGSFPILLLSGEQGSGKSGAARVLQALLDPSTITGRGTPREEREFYITLMARHLFAGDNLSDIPGWLSDAMCRASEGGSFSTRALNTDSDEIIYTVARPILLASILSTLVTRLDLMDRTLVVQLCPPKVRLTEAELTEKFTRLWPGLFALILDGLSSSLRNVATTKLENPPRMIDAATWAEAASEGLGIPPGTIARAWSQNRDASDRAALEVDDVAQAVLVLLEAEGGTWKGSPADMYRRLCELTAERVIRSPQWPKNAAGLGNKLTRLAPGLRRVHRVEATNGKGGADGSRWWSVRRL